MKIKERKLIGWQLWIEDVSHGTFTFLQDIHDYLQEGEYYSGSLNDLQAIQIDAVFREREVKNETA